MSLLMNISFDCECGEHVNEIVYVQPPDFSAEKTKDSQTDSWQEVYCPSCDKEYTIQVTNTFYGAMASTDSGNIDINYGNPYYPGDDQDELNWVIESQNQIDIFKAQISSVERLLSIEIEGDAKFSMQVMLYGHVVAAVEAYLSSTFIHNVTNSDRLIRKLVETDPTFSKRTFTLKEIFEKRESIKLTVANYLKDIIFHDLKKIKPMYRDVFEYDFGDISWLFQAVLVRHHCVHRAGYDKDGNKIEVSDEVLRDLVFKSVELVEALEVRAKEIEFDNELPF
ncbi:hypothetical protein [Simiduia agarivorans]|uniref:Uncharacterized protein n=1 Tax=Simiduia agarivorans (strain DSM 21679 / JCM 13881 / BCRC 17597 / SA1) TaxID=1117647 RepID=R9S5T8_SIMAS|nr:hypothetical protein [Simiduia agarivorans]AGN11349.1 hypothetical protein M5M_13467 [Simiduia agarivorans SA1 = DSM 21679]